MFSFHQIIYAGSAFVIKFISSLLNCFSECIVDPAVPRVSSVQSIGSSNQILSMAVSNEQAYREMIRLMSDDIDELAPIDGDADEMIDGRVTNDSLCSSALLLLADQVTCTLAIL